jgi:hypothetical protein
MGIATQLHPSLLARIDAEKFLSSISFVIDGEHVRAPSWDLSPTWEGEDVMIGKNYGSLLQSAFNVDSFSELAKESLTDLMRLWNSDSWQTEHPFNKPSLTEARESWLAHVKEEAAAIPVSASIREAELIGLDERFQGRRKGRFASAIHQVGKGKGKGKGKGTGKGKGKGKGKRKREEDDEDEDEDEDEDSELGSKDTPPPAKKKKMQPKASEKTEREEDEDRDYEPGSKKKPSSAKKLKKTQPPPAKKTQPKAGETTNRSM